MKCQCDALNIIEDGWNAYEYADSHLIKVEARNWELVYGCPFMGTRWIMDWPHGELQGEGPPRLRKLPIEEEKF
jgi:hypothetical protein